MSVKCAVYIRKSTEKGLDQNFNSLHNQEEACKNYILSQAFNNWEYYKTFEDAAISGGTTNRPALQQMMAEIKAGKIQTVIVYKVDRLSRTIVDFHNIMKILEEYDCNFVSITQSFDTSNSMGKLTLNMLLSFAQFEREVSAERVRDKVASSKQKGYWMGGVAPMGYDSINKELVINEKDAELVRMIFSKYTEFKSIYLLKDWLDENNYTTTLRVTKTGKSIGGKPFGSSHLHQMINNPIYIGKIKHLDKVYKGRHKAIIPKELWDEAQKVLSLNSNRIKNKGKKKSPQQYLLKDLAYYQDKKLMFTYSKKKTYVNHYYVYDKVNYINANYLEAQVMNTIKIILKQAIFYYPPEAYSKLKFIDIDSLTPTKQKRLVTTLIKKVTIESSLSIKVEFNQNPKIPDTLRSDDILEFDKEKNLNIYIKEDSIIIHRSIDLNNIRSNNLIVGNAQINEPNSEELAAIATAFKYRKLYEELGTIKALRETLNHGDRKIYKYLNLAYLSPTIINKILDNQLPNVTVTQLIDIASKTYTWVEQEEMLSKL